MTVFSDIAKLIDAGYSVEDAFRKTAGYETSISDNATDIATNTSNISTNTTNIALKANLAGDNVFTGTQQYSAGEGVVFNGDSITAANTLDDYEEGTWTPTLTDGTNENATYTSRQGDYIKIGRMVYIRLDVATSAIGSISGNLTIEGLPFTSSGHAAVVAGYGAGLNITAGYTPSGYAGSSSTDISLTLWDIAQGVSALHSSEWSSNGRLIMQGAYKVAL